MFGHGARALGYVAWPGLMLYGTVLFCLGPCGGKQRCSSTRRRPAPAGRAPLGMLTATISAGGCGWRCRMEARLTTGASAPRSGRSIWASADYGFEGRTAPGTRIGDLRLKHHNHADLQLQTVRLGLNYRFGAEKPHRSTEIIAAALRGWPVQARPFGAVLAKSCLFCSGSRLLEA